MPPRVPRLVSYKDLLQPALQRRFASTAGVLLAAAYIQAITLTKWDHAIWSWFPLGLAGLRTLGIFASTLPIVILRIAHCHMGIRTSNSPFDTFRRYAFSLSTIETLLTFAISAWIFSQTYLFSIPTSANIGWITYYSGDRARLNERALFYTVNIVLLGITQGIIHLTLDFDKMVLGTVKPNRGGEATTPAITGWDVLGVYIPSIIVRAGMVSISTSLANYIVLYHYIRPYAWSWALSFFRIFYNLPKYNIPPYQAPWSVWMLGRSMWAGFLMCSLWYIGDNVFKVQLTKAPLKNNRPLSVECRDPNGSLLAGLKSQKTRIVSFAMWELALIARDFDDRRRSIFEDIDRKDGPMWSQIYAACIGKIQLLEKRVEEYGKPPTPPAAQPAAAAPPQQPARIVPPPKTDDIEIPAPQRRLQTSLSKFVSSPGKSPAETYLPEVKRRVLEAKDRLLADEQKQVLASVPVNTLFHSLASRVLRTPVIGGLFQQTFGRRISTCVLGEPFGEVSIYVNAAYILSALAVSSLTEDRYGNVQRDVPTIIRTFTRVIMRLEKFKDELPIHWTDIEGRRECQVSDEILDALKDGLDELITAFGEFAGDLRLTRADMRLAREAAVKRQANAEEGPNENGAINGAANGAANRAANRATREAPPAQPEMRQVH
ncbi:nucleoporin protein Ndc1-Nup [Hypoxylon trugodes]|uniref:nucleoporin protein Ndc1-Nup n=1 Tax=Hypoxylon trugodes TaxID=326681 RepID=UPI00219ADCA1|nr:nucleoporin protein Ndc1-Nup [Hypoxylon trugodes]KAI1389147.1 nucleoporin protein Ndc1-Nup [Hypoxylon trugodes]